MKCLKLILVVTLTYVMCSCGAKGTSANEADRTETEVAQSDSTIKAQDYSDFIKTVYANFVFETDKDSKVSSHPERYFTVNALNKLKEGISNIPPGGSIASRSQSLPRRGYLTMNFFTLFPVLFI